MSWKTTLRHFKDGHFNNDLSISRMTTDEALEILCKYGKTWLSKGDNGWHCCVDVLITGENVKFEVKTDYKQETPKLAARNCLKLLNNTIEQIKSTT